MQRSGGRYEVKDGKAQLVERTQPQPDGGPRDADGRPLRGAPVASSPAGVTRGSGEGQAAKGSRVKPKDDELRGA